MNETTTTSWMTTGLACLAVSMTPGADEVPAAAAQTVLMDGSYRLGNAVSDLDTNPGLETLGDPVVDDYQPRTDLGRRLLELRRAYLRGGGRLLTQDEVLAEVRRRRGEPVEDA